MIVELIGNYCVMTNRLLIFDFDGTLADCKELHQQTFREAVNAVCPGVQYQDEDMEGLPSKIKADTLLKQGYDFDKKKLLDIKQSLTMEKIQDFIELDNSLVETIQSLNKKYKLAVCSNATKEFVNKSLEIMGLSNIGIVCTASDFKAKPEVDMYFYAMYHYGHTPNETVIFEDSKVGIEAAISTGANVVTISNVTDLKEKLNEY